MSVKKIRLISIVISIAIILFLIILGPVQAFLLTIAAANPLSFIGDKIFFNVSASTATDEFLKVNFFTLNITGPKNISCSFFPNSTFVSSCPILNISIIENSSFNFGYGYGYGLPNSSLKYKISLNTLLFLEGNYTAALYADTDSGSFSSSKAVFRLLKRSSGPEITKIDGCSIRAKDGSTIFNKTNFGSLNRLNLFTSSKGAKNGKGFFTSQRNRDRISYSFDVLNASRIGNSLITLETSGMMRFSQKGMQAENATIKYFPLKELVEIKGKIFSVKNMEVNFALCQ